MAGGGQQNEWTQVWFDDLSLGFSGGTADTRYRASLNHMDNQGVIKNNGFQRWQAPQTAQSRPRSRGPLMAPPPL